MGRPMSTGTHGPQASPDAKLVEALRQGDESAFRALLDRYHAAMIRVAGAYVESRAAAEEAAREAWLAILVRADRFQGESTLRTWVLGILVECARKRADGGGAGGAGTPFAFRLDPGTAPEPSVDPERFHGSDHPEWPHHWISFPPGWDGIPKERMVSAETLEFVGRVVEELPPAEREVLMLRDIEGCTSEEACSVLRISWSKEKILLQQARARVRRRLGQFLGAEPEREGEP
jgi:RNA polymerase sigma-70 factor (ECF subfamily)